MTFATLRRCKTIWQLRTFKEIDFMEEEINKDILDNVTILDKH